MTAQTDAPPTVPSRQNLRHLRVLFSYLRPYRLYMAGAFLALSLAAGTVLAFGAGLRWLIDDSSARESMSRKGRQRADLFRWDDCARAHASAYTEAAS